MLAVQSAAQIHIKHAIARGLFATRFSDGLMGNDAFMARRIQMTPLRRVGEPREVAGAAVFLAAPAGGFVNGQVLIVDGGTVITDRS